MARFNQSWHDAADEYDALPPATKERVREIFYRNQKREEDDALTLRAAMATVEAQMVQERIAQGAEEYEEIMLAQGATDGSV